MKKAVISTSYKSGIGQHYLEYLDVLVSLGLIRVFLQ